MMIYRNNKLRFSLLALLLALAVFSNLSFTLARPAKGTCMPPSPPPAYMPPSANTVAGWGDSTAGQLSIPAGLTDVVAISAGGTHSLALKTLGTVVGWGDNTYGQATPPAGLTNVTAISAGGGFFVGGGHSLALKSDGTIVAWGDNSSGQATPPAIGGCVTVAAISAGAFHSLALLSDGTVVGWGDDTFGQATPPAGLSGVAAISAGLAHSLALLSDGTVVGWGNTLGAGGETPPAGLSGVMAISAGLLHSLALKSDGTVVGWGDSFGTGAGTPPAGLSGVTAISAGSVHSLALKSDGTVVGWGDNTVCQATPPGCVSNPAAISAGGVHSLAMQTTACVQIGCPNTAPTIAATGVTRIQGTSGNSQIASALDAEDAENTLTVTATPNSGSGVTLSSIAVDGSGNVTANVSAACNATTSTFTLAVKDSQNVTATDTLTVTVNLNPAPTLGAYPNAGPIIAGTGTTVTPAAPPGDNVSVASVTVAASAGFTGSLSVHPTTGVVTISNAGPTGMWVVMVTVTDNCGATTIRQFTLSVQTAQQSLQALIAQVNALVPSTLTSQKANSLTNKLDSAIKALNNGNISAACTHIQDFIDLVNNYIGNGTLTSAQGQPLIDAATAIRAALGCS